MKKEINIPVENSIVFVMDYEYGELPESLDDGLITTTSSSIVVSTRPDIDGPVDIVLTDDPFQNDDNMLHIVWSGKIEAPNNDISVCSVNNDRLMAIGVSRSDPFIQVWANDDEEPDRLVIVVDTGD